MDIQGTASYLRLHLGTTLTAALTGANDRTLPDGWSDGSAQPNLAETARLNFAYAVFRQVSKSDSADVARALFIGANPDLGDDTIITAIREDRFLEVHAAADSFVTA